MHLYTMAGKPVYKVPYVDKKRVGEMRAPTLADARKRGLVPSVTEILGILDKPGLTRWKIDNHIQAALTQPRDGRPVDDLIPAIKANADEFSRVARDLGTRYHDAAEEMAREVESGTRIRLSHIRPGVSLTTMAALREWYTNRVDECIAVEQSFAHPLGFGGRIDWLGVLVGDLTLIDWKTQGTKPGRQIRFYPEWAAQLAAYAYGLGYDLGEINLTSVVISTTEPGRIQSQTWLDGADYFGAFLHAFELWKGPLGKRFDPALNAAKLVA